ncbi:conserved hypothetical protein [Neospora caninum Liverpool]|uniref:Uncharacterized protein n=1 Tax=Neospora caninum (strain Liverpool) TaxID=572307 RepID=F0VPT0_NEOCL|nr:conserved hypothetical protein [Neospora caninum Liverpool]CBZ55727.1 conserved hypothetical protein [Neospora caninum Liverpool]CEL70469.1 TPA: hypothetical protein BN1204_061520 [Neospora caninum Liverpool]|eukprot:XP_003885753.1 conserved hypothetical protein [Neospora caninum Liverpool]
MRPNSAICFLLGAGACFIVAPFGRSETRPFKSHKGVESLTKLRHISAHQPPFGLQKQWLRFVEPELRAQTALVNADTTLSSDTRAGGEPPVGPADEGAVGNEASLAEDFLIVPHTRTYCEGKAIQRAQDVSTVG